MIYHVSFFRLGLVFLAVIVSWDNTSTLCAHENGLADLPIITLSDAKDATKPLAEIIAKKSPAIRLVRCGIPSAAMKLIATSPSIKHLEFEQCDLMPGAASELRRNKSIESIRCDDESSAREFVAVFKEMDIKKVVLRGKDIVDEDVALISECTSIRILDVASTGITDKSLAKFGNLRSLESLNIGYTQISAQGIRTMPPFPAIWDFCCSGLDVRDEDMDNCPIVKQLRVFDAVDTGITGGFLSKMEQLERLVLYGKGVSDESIQGMQKLSKLRDLSLYHTSVSSRGLKSFPRGLKRLVLSSCLITDEGASTIAEYKALKELRITCCKIGDAACDAIKQLDHLETLSFAETNISDRGCEQLVMFCKRLKKVNAHASALTERGALALLSLPRLEELNVGHTKLTEEEFNRLVMHHRRIKIFENSTSP